MLNPEQIRPGREELLLPVDGQPDGGCHQQLARHQDGGRTQDPPLTARPGRYGYHVTAVFNADTDIHTLAVNGVIQTHSVSEPAFNNTDPIQVPRIGRRPGGDTAPFEGTIDDVRVYNRALSAEEISRLYGLGATTRVSETLTTNPQLESGLVGHWTFDGENMDPTTYVLACTGDGGTATTSAAVSVTSATATPVTVFTDGFETALNWTRAGNTTWYTGTPKTGTHSVRLIQTGYIQKTIPLTGYQDGSVSFSMGANSLDTASEYVEALYYNGSSWVSLARINENNLLNPYTFTLPTSVNDLSSFALRFRITGDKKDYGYVDEVKVTGMQR